MGVLECIKFNKALSSALTSRVRIHRRWKVKRGSTSRYFMPLFLLLVSHNKFARTSAAGTSHAFVSIWSYFIFLFLTLVYLFRRWRCFASWYWYCRTNVRVFPGVDFRGLYEWYVHRNGSTIIIFGADT